MIVEAVKKIMSEAVLKPGNAFVGFSGGIDSTALLLALTEAGCPVTAVHFQHGLRGAAAEADAQWCRTFCQQRNIPFRCSYLDVPHNLKTGETTEEAARRLRLEQWENIASGGVVFLAHHADDVLEELFLRLARGANASGLTGLREDRTIRHVRFLRPLLNHTKEQLRHFIEARGITDWRLDATNCQNDYRRNAVRNQLIPLARKIFQTDSGFRQAIWALRQDADHLEQEARTWAKKQLDRTQWAHLSPAMLPRVFRLWRQTQDGRDEPPSRKFMDCLRKALDNQEQTVRNLQLDPHHQIRVDGQGLRLERLEEAPPAPPFVRCWNWRKEPAVTLPEAGVLLTVSPEPQVPGEVAERFALSDLPELITIRSWRPGDRMVPFGHHTPKKLQDLFTDVHLPPRRKHQVPLLCAGQLIFWIPFVKRGEFGRTSPGKPSVTLRVLPLP